MSTLVSTLFTSELLKKKNNILLTLGRHNYYVVMTIVNFAHTHENHKETRS